VSADPGLEVDALRARFDRDLADARSVADLRGVRDRYLARKAGLLSGLLKALGHASPADRPRLGQLANTLKEEIETRLADRLAAESATRPPAGAVDITLPGRRPRIGHRHPLTILRERIEAIFTRFGFLVIEGAELEDDYHNFEALNIPKDHPARDMQDTFFVAAGRLLRTHTSPVQIRTMETRKPPLQVIVPGAVYRHDDDATHSPMFHQVEGFMVDERITFADLKGVLTHFLRQIFERDAGVRFRPSFFPFTEPSAEIDIQCVICGGSGAHRDGQTCRVCKATGWLEILGAGMIDPAVFQFVGYDPEKVSGFAFGMGVERIAMLKYGIDDIRLFFQNDLRFLRQFS
jgi:phenylalanyl-tRNA synthetase alpha chain